MNWTMYKKEYSKTSLYLVVRFYTVSNHPNTRSEVVQPRFIKRKAGMPRTVYLHFMYTKRYVNSQAIQKIWIQKTQKFYEHRKILG